MKADVDVVVFDDLPDMAYHRTRPTDTDWRERYDLDWFVNGLPEPVLPENVYEWHERGWESPEVAGIKGAVRGRGRQDGEGDRVTCLHPDSWFDRSLCPEPCGSMHDRCSECGTVLGFCPLEAGRIVASEIGAAWVDVYANLPEGWVFSRLVYVPPWSKLAAKRGAHWRAKAQRRADLGLPPAGMDGVGSDALTALTRLADHLTNINPARAAERLDDALSRYRSWAAANAVSQAIVASMVAKPPV